MATAAVKSAITYIDGDAGILRYRGYPIEELAETCGFLEISHLLLSGELPNDQELASWQEEITHHTFIHENIKKFIDGFRHDAHPMGILMSTVAAFPLQPGGEADHEPILATSSRSSYSEAPKIAAFATHAAASVSYADNDLIYAGTSST